MIPDCQVRRKYLIAVLRVFLHLTLEDSGVYGFESTLRVTTVSVVDRTKKREMRPVEQRVRLRNGEVKYVTRRRGGERNGLEYDIKE